MDDASIVIEALWVEKHYEIDTITQSVYRHTHEFTHEQRTKASRAD